MIFLIHDDKSSPPFFDSNSELELKNFVADLRRLDMRHGGSGNVAVGFALDYFQNPFAN